MAGEKRRSIFVEHCLDGLRIMCLGQRQLEQDTCFLRVQRVTVDEMLIDVGLFSRDNGSRTDTRTADDDDSLLGSLGKCCFICFVDRAIARARVDDALCACSDSRIDERSVGTSRAVDDIDLRQRGQLADIELTLDRVQADWRIAERRVAIIDVAG